MAVQLDTPMTLWTAEQYLDGFSAAGFEEVEQSQLCACPETIDAKAFPGTLFTTGYRVA